MIDFLFFFEKCERLFSSAARRDLQGGVLSGYFSRERRVVPGHFMIRRDNGDTASACLVMGEIRVDSKKMREIRVESAHVP